MQHLIGTLNNKNNTPVCKMFISSADTRAKSYRIHKHIEFEISLSVSGSTGFSGLSEDPLPDPPHAAKVKAIASANVTTKNFLIMYFPPFIFLPQAVFTDIFDAVSFSGFIKIDLITKFFAF